MKSVSVAIRSDSKIGQGARLSRYEDIIREAFHSPWLRTWFRAIPDCMSYASTMERCSPETILNALRNPKA